jgi:hypothetical protein
MIRLILAERAFRVKACTSVDSTQAMMPDAAAAAPSSHQLVSHQWRSRRRGNEL